jgi:hypothetical protein
MGLRAQGWAHLALVRLFLLLVLVGLSHAPDSPPPPSDRLERPNKRQKTGEGGIGLMAAATTSCQASHLVTPHAQHAARQGPLSVDSMVVASLPTPGGGDSGLRNQMVAGFLPSLFGSAESPGLGDTSAAALGEATPSDVGVNNENPPLDPSQIQVQVQEEEHGYHDAGAPFAMDMAEAERLAAARARASGSGCLASSLSCDAASIPIAIAPTARYDEDWPDTAFDGPSHNPGQGPSSEGATEKDQQTSSADYFSSPRQKFPGKERLSPSCRSSRIVLAATGVAQDWRWRNTASFRSGEGSSFFFGGTPASSPPSLLSF